MIASSWFIVGLLVGIGVTTFVFVIALLLAPRTMGEFPEEKEEDK